MNLRTWAVLVAVGLLLSGCNQEAPHKREVSGSVNAPGSQASLEERMKRGELLFKQNCAPCHPEGGNVSDPQRNLRGSALRANHITKPEDIVRIMRHPVSRMIAFDATTISERDARAIAEYVLATFK
jgi:cytochrome c6